MTVESPSFDESRINTVYFLVCVYISILFSEDRTASLLHAEVNNTLLLNTTQRAEVSCWSEVLDLY